MVSPVGREQQRHGPPIDRCARREAVLPEQDLAQEPPDRPRARLTGREGATSALLQMRHHAIELRGRAGAIDPLEDDEQRRALAWGELAHAVELADLHVVGRLWKSVRA